MGAVGKIIGGTIGFALGGPLGAIAGAVFGHAFDSSQFEARPSDDRRHLSGIEASQLAFFVGAFSMLAKLAKADGQVSRSEIDTIESFAINDLHLGPEERDVAFNIFRTAVASPADFSEFALQFFGHFRHQPHLLEMMIDILIRVSLADGTLNSSEERLILSAAKIFQISTDRYHQIKSRYVATNDQAYHTLGCQKQDSDETIKSRYRHLVQSYHPDKIASKGLPEEFLKLAHEKFREIQEAYNAIKAERGIK